MKELLESVVSFYFMELNFLFFFSFWSHSDLLTVPSKGKKIQYLKIYFLNV